MNYKKLLEIANILDEKERIKSFINYYSSLKIKGLNYVDFNGKQNIVHLSTPEHEIHHEATCFLLKMKHENGRINTVSASAHKLKKFLDFIMIWNFNLVEVDLLIVMSSFATYLQILKKIRAPYSALEWSLIDKIPLHERALSLNNVTSISHDKEGFMSKDTFEDYDLDTISKFIKVALDYLEFLKNYTVKYEEIDINVLPVRVIKQNTMISGTTNKNKEVVVFNIKAILNEAGIDTKLMSNDKVKPLSEEVFSVEEVKGFMSLIPDNDTQSKLLFEILKCFGLRRAEACNLMINTRNIPKEFYLWDLNDAKKWIKSNLKGDIEFDERLGKWVCSVVRRDTFDFQSQHKSKSRNIPLLFSQEDFLSLLIDHIFERQIVLETTNLSHDFLFYSNANNSKGKPISGGSIYSKYNSLIKGLDSFNVYSKFSPHTFRHFFATYLIRVRKESLFFVSQWLGHSNENITKRIYLHYLPSNEEHRDDSSFTTDMIDTFSEKM